MSSWADKGASVGGQFANENIINRNVEAIHEV